MDVRYERCCGLDIHKRVVVACLIVPGKEQGPRKELRSFGTETRGLLELAEWLAVNGCAAVAMESTGSYWKPLYNLLEGDYELLLVNTRHLKLVPGRKRDVKDAEWIADLLRHGLLQASFVPGRPERELRELTRYRTSLVRERAAEVNRIQKVLEGANIKLASVASDVMGVSGRAILEALVAGVEDAAGMAQLARGRLREKREQLEQALVGLVGEHQRFMLARQLRHVDELGQLIAEVDEEIATRLHPFEEKLARLQTIPGVGRRLAEVIISEVGVDMARFPTSGHLASWAGVCPGMNESAGKNRSGRTRKANPWLRSALVQAAQAASRSPGFLGQRFRRLTVRLGRNKAALAVAHSILVAIYRLLKDGTDYTDLGPEHFAQREREQTARRLTRRLEHLGYQVTVLPTAS
jgi:transposase